MSRRDTERDRDRGAGRARETARTNEYFVPRDGIDREVITADICRYLGNDALVRPGNYENPQTRVAQQGYFINAYRNLTTEMIADLKADSARWEQERRQTASRGQPQNVEYRSSTTHQSRQYYGPTEAGPPQTSGYPATGGYQAAATTAQGQGVYDSQQYQNSSGYSQPAQTYPGVAQGYGSQDNYYVGANLNVDQQRSDRPGGQSGAVPRTAVPSYTTPTYQQADSRGYYVQPGASPVSAQQGYSQPSDPFYGRGAYNHSQFL